MGEAPPPQPQQGPPKSPLELQPGTVELPAGGGAAQHLISNNSSSPLALKIKLTDTTLYRARPVFGTIAPNSLSGIELSRDPGPPKADQLIIEFLPIPMSSLDRDPSALFKQEGVKPQRMRVNIQVKE